MIWLNKIDPDRPFLAHRVESFKLENIQNFSSFRVARPSDPLKDQDHYMNISAKFYDKL